MVSRPRRLIRRCLAIAFGLKGYLDVWWTPQLPVVYINNPKSGCSTVKNSLKLAQAGRYRSEGRSTFQHDRYPHIADDCLTRHGFSELGRGGPRLVISCVRNPYTRALSAYLDKAMHGQIHLYPELRGERPASFEAFLLALAAHPVRRLDAHFSPQWINLGLPKVKYEAIFYLENIAALRNALRRFISNFEVEDSIPHARGASEKLKTFYTPQAIALTQRLYADDFALFSYSLELDRALEPPGEFWTPRKLVPLNENVPIAPAEGLLSLNRVIRYRQLLEAGII